MVNRETFAVASPKLSEEVSSCRCRCRFLSQLPGEWHSLRLLHLATDVD